MMASTSDPQTSIPPDYGPRVVAERRDLAERDPAGELEAVRPVLSPDVLFWEDEIAKPLRHDPTAWPSPPGEAAYHGPAGALVAAVRESTEADPVALLGSVLATFGALAGHYRTMWQGSTQAANLFIALVGDSSSGRKGTAWSVTREMFGAAYPEWERLIVPGLGSGEGLIGHLKRGEGTEHRALVLETELGRLLGVMAREGSSLSPTLRDAWDGSALGRFLAREEALVTWHHVGLLAHVTPVELRAKLTSVDAANGFGNRFLWLAVRRQRLVPFPESPRGLIAPHVEALHRAIVEAQTPAELAWTPAAAGRWEALYVDLALRSRRGLAGAITARAEAQVARLALTYALLDRSRDVDLAHLEAALALWDYAERSAVYLFGESTGDPLADELLRYLRVDRQRMTRQRLRDELGVRDSARLSAAIGTLAGLGLAITGKGSTGSTGGRPAEWVELVGEVSAVSAVSA